MKYLSVDTPLIVWGVPIILMMIAVGPRATAGALFGRASANTGPILTAVRRLSWTIAALAGAVIMVDGPSPIAVHQTALMVGYSAILAGYTILRGAKGATG